MGCSVIWLFNPSFEINFVSCVADSFACAVLSLSAAQYYTLTDGEFSMLLAIFIISTTCTSASVCFGYTLMWSFDKSLFRPRVKWGPVSFMKLKKSRYQKQHIFRYIFTSGLPMEIQTYGRGGAVVPIYTISDFV